MFLTVAYSYPSGSTHSYRALETDTDQRIRDVIRAGGTITALVDDDGTSLPLPVQTGDGRIWCWWKGDLYSDGNGSAVPKAMLLHAIA